MNNLEALLQNMEEESPSRFSEFTIFTESSEIKLPKSFKTYDVTKYLSNQSRVQVCLQPTNLPRRSVSVKQEEKPLNTNLKSSLVLLHYYLNMDTIHKITPHEQQNHWYVETSNIEQLCLPSMEYNPVQIYSIQPTSRGHNVHLSVSEKIYLYCPTCGSSLATTTIDPDLSSQPDEQLVCSYCTYTRSFWDHFHEQVGTTIPDSLNITFNTYFRV
jgi:hypothetical protein